jgi:hypothetical protein
MTASSRRPPAALLAALLLAAPAAAAEKGSWWELTTTMEMPGMPFAMPPTTLKFCQPEGPPKAPPDAKPDPNCKMTDMRTSGNTMKWKVVCTGQNAMEGEGEMTSTGSTMDGTTRLKMERGEMTMKMHGKKIGPACDPEAERKAVEAKVEHYKEQARTQQAQAANTMVRLCDDAIRGLSAAAVAGSSPTCPPERRPEFCAKARTEDGWLKLQEAAPIEKQTKGQFPGPRAVATACAYEEAALLKQLCPGAEKKGKLAFLAAACPVEAKALAKKECAGRDYTALQGSRYRDFCARLKGEAMEGAAEPKADGEEKKKDPQEEAVDKGKKLLKGVLGF